jgi:hypothetical protein
MDPSSERNNKYFFFYEDTEEEFFVSSLEGSRLFWIKPPSLSFKHVRIESCWVHPGYPCCPLTLFSNLHFL